MNDFNQQFDDSNNATYDKWESGRVRKSGSWWSKCAGVLISLGVVLFVVGWLTGARGGRVYFDGGLRVTTLSAEEREPMEVGLGFDTNIIEVVVNTSSSPIRFVPSTTDNVVVTARDSNQLSTRESGNRLYVNAHPAGNMQILNGVHWRRGSVMSFGNFGVSWNRVNDDRFVEFNFSPSVFRRSNFTNAVYVYVPAGMQVIEGRAASGSIRAENVSANRLTLRANSGSVTVDGGTFGETRLNTTSGSVRLLNSSTDSLEMRANSGSVTVDGGTHGNTQLNTTSGSISGDAIFTGDIYARANSGRVRITDGSTSRSTGNIELRATSGRVEFTTAAPASDFNYRVNVTSGRMDINGTRHGGRSTSGGTGNVPIDARTNSGGVTLSFGQ